MGAYPNSSPSPPTVDEIPRSASTWSRWFPDPLLAVVDPALPCCGRTPDQHSPSGFTNLHEKPEL
ncbi:hypothetical protein E2C01_061226 [Portunus trituberculatus]|uniref:Uncharacterized protein n=1 Tax=Portunus trituberculatus TaxID=210409 RepID=A0A5B7H7J5_PORTR|nr:hypothetical protein [Portunus trituberculatus]